MNVLNIEDAVELTKSNKKIVFITGVTGQCGSYMVDYLLDNTDYVIFGGVRRLSVSNYKNLQNVKTHLNRFALVNFDLTDPHTINECIESLMPDYFINFAAQSFVGSSWNFPAQTWECNTTGVIHILEAIRKYKPTCRSYYSGSSEEFGDVIYSPQDEQHPQRPRSPYGASKAAGRQLVKVYRESYGLYAIQGMLFNNESPRRGEEFVTRKITLGVANIKKSLLNNTTFSPIELGNVYSERDWSHSKDFIDGIWKMLNQEKPKEYILSSNEIHTVKEFVEKAFACSDIQGQWHGHGINEEFCIDVKCAERFSTKSSILVKINPKFYRPAEVDKLLGNSNLARKELGWSPKIGFNELVKEMVESDTKNI